MSDMEKTAARMRAALKDWENAKAWHAAAERAVADARQAAWNAGIRYHDLVADLERLALEEDKAAKAS